MAETSTKPYLIRAIYEWCTDNGYRPYIAVVVDETTEVPMDFVRNGEIVLNVSADATSQLAIGNEMIEFEARFNRIARRVSIPITNVSAVYAAESGHGMAFDVHRAGDEGDASREGEAIEVQGAEEDSAPGDGGRGQVGGSGGGAGENAGENAGGNAGGNAGERERVAGGSEAAGGLRVVSSTRRAEPGRSTTRKESEAKRDRKDGGADPVRAQARPALLEAVPSPRAGSPGSTVEGADGDASNGRSDDDPGGKPPRKPPSGRKPRLTRVK